MDRSNERENTERKCECVYDPRLDYRIWSVRWRLINCEYGQILHVLAQWANYIHHSTYTKSPASMYEYRTALTFMNMYIVYVILSSFLGI